MKQLATKKKWLGIFTLGATIFLSACGGGGSGSKGSALSNNQWQAGIFPASKNFAAACASPRSGIDPITQVKYPDVRGSSYLENMWLRSWTSELYLWYNEVPDLNPANYATLDYFDLMKTSAVLPSGSLKDRFHFTYPTDVWENLAYSGVEASYGLRWALINKTPPRKLLVGYIEPNAPATLLSSGIMRGTNILAIDGIDLVNTNNNDDIDKINLALSPTTLGESHSFLVQDPGSSSSHTVVLQSASVTTTPVQNVTTISTVSGTVGYLLFNDHIATAETELIDAITTLKNSGVNDLVLDMRYNGGGYLAIASELAYMIAGPATTSGATFESIHFNAKHPTTDPVTNQPLTPTPFYNTTLGFSATAGQTLPTLNLSRVFILTGPGTCSASESVINGLRGVNVDVIQIGSTTCGKPFGFYATDNCGTTYFSIQFQGTNAQGFGDYEDGFSPANTASEPGVLIPGCSVADDFNHALGDANEGRLAAALNYRLTQTCPSPATGFAPSLFEQMRPTGAGAAIELPALHQNRILSHP